MLGFSLFRATNYFMKSSNEQKGLRDMSDFRRSQHRFEAAEPYLKDISLLGPEGIRARLSAAGWKFGGYTSGLPVVKGGIILQYMAEGKRCHLYYDPEEGWFMIRPF